MSNGYSVDRTQAMQREAMRLIYVADTSKTDLPVEVRNTMYARASALCCLVRCEIWNGELRHPLADVNEYFAREFR